MTYVEILRQLHVICRKSDGETRTRLKQLIKDLQLSCQGPVDMSFKEINLPSNSATALFLAANPRTVFDELKQELLDQARKVAKEIFSAGRFP